MKKIVALLLAFIALLSLSACASKKDEGDKEKKEQVVLEGLLDITPEYIGEEIKSTIHDFNTDEFRVLAAFKGEEYLRQVYGFEIDDVTAADGCFIVTISYGGCSNQCYVPININFFASDN